MTSAGILLSLIRQGTAVTRSEMARHTGLARATVAQRLETLMARDLVYEAGSGQTGGRPAAVLAFNPGAGAVLVADLGSANPRLAVCDLAGAILADETVELDIWRGAEPTLESLDARMLVLLKRSGRRLTDVRGIGVCVPGSTPLWNGFPIADWLDARYGAPAFVDNDATLMALGEHSIHWRDTEHLVFVKAGVGIGCGLILDSQPHRGAGGAAGDIGHMRVAGETVTCACGNRGCLDAVSGGAALAVQLGVPSVTDVVAAVRSGEPAAAAAVREAGRQIGEVLTDGLRLLNPAAVIVGGELAMAHQPLLAGLRETIFQRSMPLATDEIRIVTSRLGLRAAIVGAAILVTEQVLTPEAIDRTLRAA